jgi:hypothetical protein
VRDKKKLTEELVKQLDPDQGITVKRAMHTWWFNIRKNGGMRLTGPGYTVFTEQLDLARYEWPIQDPHGNSINMLFWPWIEKSRCLTTFQPPKAYLKKLCFLAAKEAVMVNCMEISNNSLTTTSLDVILLSQGL